MDHLDLITYSIHHSPGKANRFAASQEIRHILWNPKVHYRIHKCKPPAPILSRSSIGSLSTLWYIMILDVHMVAVLQIAKKWKI
jgi:hypothetical protein